MHTALKNCKKGTFKILILLPTTTKVGTIAERRYPIHNSIIGIIALFFIYMNSMRFSFTRRFSTSNK